MAPIHLFLLLFAAVVFQGVIEVIYPVPLLPNFLAYLPKNFLLLFGEVTEEEECPGDWFRERR